MYIENLRKKVTILFDELSNEHRLGEENFIKAFKQRYPRDYSLLQYEWEFKLHEFKKNRKGQPKAHPIRPEKILSNVYKNYYYKLIKRPAIEAARNKEINTFRIRAGRLGYKIVENDKKKYDVVEKNTKAIIYADVTYSGLNDLFGRYRIAERKGKLRLKTHDAKNI